jgi:hypothetical protein
MICEVKNGGPTAEGYIPAFEPFLHTASACIRKPFGYDQIGAQLWHDSPSAGPNP